MFSAVETEFVFNTFFVTIGLAALFNVLFWFAVYRKSDLRAMQALIGTLIWLVASAIAFLLDVPAAGCRLVVGGFGLFHFFAFALGPHEVPQRQELRGLDTDSVIAFGLISCVTLCGIVYAIYCWL